MKKMLFSIKGILTAISAMLVLIVSLIASYETAPPADISLGAIPGNEVNGNIFIVGGLDKAYFRTGFSAASSTMCGFRNPFQATSSIQSYSVQITRGVLGANSFDIATSSVRGATSSPALMAAVQVATLVTDSYSGVPNSATTTLINGDGGEVLAGLKRSANGTAGVSNYILGPNEYVNFELATSTNTGSFATPMLGSCTLELKRL